MNGKPEIPVSHEEISPYLALDPPVTKRSLECLDLEVVKNDLKLLHNLVVDPDTHMRPNDHGPAAKEKRFRATLFWRTLDSQLTAFLDPSKREHFVRTCGLNGDWCLPRFLHTVKDILVSFMLPSNRQIVEEGLHIENIMQQYYDGHLEVGEVADWLSGVMRSRCTPMRDEWVYWMADLIRSGNQERNVGRLVQGLCELLSLLEVTKLDITNHGIRGYRTFIIKDIVQIEQQFFAKQIAQGLVSVVEAKEWYRGIERGCEGNQPCASRRMQIFFKGLCHLVLPSMDRIPSTFRHDCNRIMCIREELLNMINIVVCSQVLRDLEHGNDHNRTAQDGSVTLRNYLLNLLQTTPHETPSEFWRSAVPRIAVEMSRSVNANAPEHIESAETRLRNSISRYDSDIFRQGQGYVHQHLLSQVLSKIKNVQIFEALSVSLDRLVSEREIPKSNHGRHEGDEGDEGLKNQICDLSTRIARVGILHWAIWGEHAYTEE